jgi:hypothetical protein
VNDDLYNSAEARLDTVAGRHAYWMRLTSAKKEYDILRASSGGLELPNFRNYIRDVYGVEMGVDEDGFTLPTYIILEEQKHLIFLLKHSKHEN